MLAAEDLDVVSVATPSFLHHDHVVDTVESEASPDVIWCEKPIASSVSDAEEMIDRCDEAGTGAVINHSFRFTDKLQTLEEHMRDGELLGDVHSVATQFRMELLRNSTHLLDTLVYLLDSRADDVSGYITGENEAVDTLEAGQTVDDSGGGYVVMDDGPSRPSTARPARGVLDDAELRRVEGQTVHEQRRRRVALLEPRR